MLDGMGGKFGCQRINSPIGPGCSELERETGRWRWR